MRAAAFKIQIPSQRQADAFSLRRMGVGLFCHAAQGLHQSEIRLGAHMKQFKTLPRVQKQEQPGKARCIHPFFAYENGAFRLQPAFDLKLIIGFFGVVVV